MTREDYGTGSYYVNEAKCRVELSFPVQGYGRQRVRASLVNPKRSIAQAKAECRRLRDERTAELSNGAGLDPETIGWLADEWVRVRQSRKSASTLAKAVWAAEIVKASPMATASTHRLTPHDIETLLVEFAATHADNTVGDLRAAINGMCRAGVAWRKMKTNPVAELDRTPKGTGRKQHRWYNLDQYGVACAWLADLGNLDTDGAAVAVMMFAGLRAQEVRALRWSSVDWDRGVLRIVEAVKGVSDADGAPKTRAGTRVVPMAPALVAVLRRHASHQLATGRTEHVFTEAGKRLTHDDITHAAQRFATQTGLDYINPHGFRHTFASVFLSRRSDYQLLAKLLGHGTVGELIKTYGHVVTDVETLDMARYVG